MAKGTQQHCFDRPFVLFRYTADTQYGGRYDFLLSWRWRMSDESFKVKAKSSLISQVQGPYLKLWKGVFRFLWPKREACGTNRTNEANEMFIIWLFFLLLTRVVGDEFRLWLRFFLSFSFFGGRGLRLCNCRFFPSNLRRPIKVVFHSKELFKSNLWQVTVICKDVDPNQARNILIGSAVAMVTY